MKYILFYLLSFTEPEISLVSYVHNDTIMFYHNGYRKEKILDKSLSVYVFKGGYISLTNQIYTVHIFREKKEKFLIKRRMEVLPEELDVK